MLGDPQVLMFDEPVNGLDPEGIVWVRNLMKSLASQGRTVLVSSHLMSEMSQTAEHLVVIGRGRLIADTTMNDFIARSSGNLVRVRSPQAQVLRDALAGRGGEVSESDEYLEVRGFRGPISKPPSERGSTRSPSACTGLASASWR